MNAMRKKRIIRALITLLMITVGTVTAQVSWYTNFEEGLSASRNQGKPALVYFYTLQAQNCQRFIQETFKDPEVIRLMQRFICVALDVNKDQRAAIISGVFRVPVILILDRNGNEMMRLVTYYPPDGFREALGNVLASFDSGKAEVESAAIISRQEEAGISPLARQAIYYESFDRLFGWGSDFSKDSYAQISLVRGVVGNAFRIDYDLKKVSPGEGSYVQFSRRLLEKERMKLPDKYTITFQLAGMGAKNNFDLKLVDSDGTNFGKITLVPTDSVWHKCQISSDDIKYLWGGDDKKFGTFSEFWFAVSSNSIIDNKIREAGRGSIVIDEFAILPGDFSGGEGEMAVESVATSTPEPVEEDHGLPRPEKYIIADHFDNLYGSNTSFDTESFAQSTIKQINSSENCACIQFEFIASPKDHFVQLGKRFTQTMPVLAKFQATLFLHYEGPPCIIQLAFTDKNNRRSIARTPLNPGTEWQKVCFDQKLFKFADKDPDASKFWIDLVFENYKNKSGKGVLMIDELFIN